MLNFWDNSHVKIFRFLENSKFFNVHFNIDILNSSIVKICFTGSVEKVSELMWVLDKENNKIIQKEVTYVPGLYKIFDEILVNAADNKQRDPKMDTIKIDIDAEANLISVYNNGAGIPVVMHKEQNMYVPTMIFGHLLTSSNYDDDEKKVTGGRNGYGAKLCNIFSTKFTVETVSKEYKRTFKQTWGANMSKASEPKVKDSTGTEFTKITFSPDLTKFKMDVLDDDLVALLSRRAYDIAASSKGVKVFLNGTRVPVKNFKEYIEFYIKDRTDDTGNALKVVHEVSSTSMFIRIYYFMILRVLCQFIIVFIFSAENIIVDFDYIINDYVLNDCS